jgi:hypothetical protein
MAELSPLRRRMIEDMTIRNLSPATQRSYVHAVAKFSRHFGRSPERLGLEDVRAFQVHLVSTGISWPALNQIVCALRFFYGVTLGHAEIPERIVYARSPRTLPTVLSADEVVRFLEAVPSLKTRTALTTAYAAGLRASETVGLKVRDIDSERGVIRVEHGKGGDEGTARCGPGRGPPAPHGECKLRLPGRRAEVDALDPGRARRSHDQSRPADLRGEAAVRGLIATIGDECRDREARQRRYPRQGVVRRTGHSRRLVRQVIRGERTDVFRVRQSSLDAHLPMLDELWNAGCRNGAELWRRLKAKGFAARYAWSASGRPAAAAPDAHPTRNFERCRRPGRSRDR